MLPIIREGLVLELHFNEFTGTTVYDLSGNGNNGTIYGALRVNEGFVRALSFDGVDDYFLVPHSSVFNVYSVSLAIWIKVFTLEAKTVNTHPLFKYEDPTKPWYGLAMRWGAAPICMEIGDGTTTYATSNYYFKDTDWHHIVGVYDAEVGAVKLYVDGKLYSTASAPTNIYLANNGPFKSPYEVGRAMILDEVLIYNRALSEQEIKTLYNYYIKKKIFER